MKPLRHRGLATVAQFVAAVSFVAAWQSLGSPLSADDWPQWRGPARDGAWNETGLIERFDGPEVPIRWRMPIASGYSGPTVADGRVYVTDRLVEPKPLERVHCFDAETGRALWRHEYEAAYDGIGYTAGPRASVLVNDGRAYSLGAAGHLHCFDAAEGRVLWRKDLREEYKVRMPDWGITAAPVVEGDRLIVMIGGEDACVVAFDRRTGEERWTALSDRATYSAPIVIDQAGRRVLVCWAAERIVGLDPATGKLHWEFPFHWEKWPIAIATPVAHGDLLLFSEVHKGTLLLRTLADRLAVEEVWHQRAEDDGDAPALHCLMSTPFIRDGHIYAADKEAVLRCLDLEAGRHLWEDESAGPRQRWGTIHLVRNADRVWLFNELGELIIARLTPRGYDEISRAKLIAPTTDQLRRREGVTWSHPAFADRHVYARNDKELVCGDLSAAADR
ncbi:MAG: PQQ-binding-like beta-propeller repeat protein [Planctomycetaceae bacterium]